MIAAWTFSESVDLTAVGTLALAAVTLVSLVFAAGSLRQTRREIDLSRLEVEEAHRPVLVPTPLSQPSVVAVSELAIAVTNIGMGPALTIEASASLLDAEGNPSLAPTGEQTPALMPGLAADSASTLTIPVDQHWGAGVSFELTLRYTDVAGKAWETVGKYLDAHQRYEALVIRRPPFDDVVEGAALRAQG